MPINRRIEILASAMGPRRFGGSFGDFLWNLLAPCQMLAARRIVRIDPGPSGTRAVWIKGCSRPLYLPEEFDLRCIQQPLAEETYTRHWHYYCTSETPIEREDIALDCGAAEGLFSFMAREKGARCITVEPNPIYMRALERTFANDDKVQLMNAALGDAPGEARLSMGAICSRVSPDGACPIRIETIDGICDQLKIAPTYIKADVEGFEDKLLKGAEETIAAYHPKIAFTTYHAENDANALAARLKWLNPNYRFRTKGLSGRPSKPVMLHAWSVC